MPLFFIPFNNNNGACHRLVRFRTKNRGQQHTRCLLYSGNAMFSYPQIYLSDETTLKRGVALCNVCVNITKNREADKSLVTISSKIANFMVIYVFFQKVKNGLGKSQQEKRDRTKGCLYTGLWMVVRAIIVVLIIHSHVKKDHHQSLLLCVGSSGGRSMSKSHHFLHNDFVVLWWQKGDPIKLPK